MKKILFLFLLCTVMATSITFAQKMFKGKVTSSADGLGIPGVIVSIKGTNLGVSTDIDGNWSLSVPTSSSILQFKYVGMKTIEVEASKASKIVMSPDTEQLDPIIVVAYGSTKKSSFTGSAVSIKSDDLVNKPVVSVGEAIDGLAAGIQVASGSGQPGSTPSIRVRGFGSISSSNEPLYVIDGVVQSNTNLMNTSKPGFADRSVASLGSLAFLNPNDIANVTILKDAAAATLYGSRAANGVVLITTKKGRSGETQFSLKTEYGVSDFAVKTLELASPKDAFDYKVMGYKNYLTEYSPKYKGKPDEAQKKAIKTISGYFNQYDPKRPDADYDWDSALFRKGYNKNIELSALGGGEKTKFFASLGYIKNTGVAVGSDFTRISGRLNLDHKANDLVEIGGKIAFSNMQQNVIPTRGFYYANPLISSRSFLNQLTPIKTPKGEFSEIQGGQKPNLLKELSLNINLNDVYIINNMAYLNLNNLFIEGLSFKSNNSFDLGLVYNHRYLSPQSRDGRGTNGVGSNKNKRNIKMTTSNVVNYNKSINEVHNISALLGYEASTVKNKLLSLAGEEFPNDTSTTLDVAAKPTGVYYNMYGDRMQSIFSSANYNYDNRYYVSASFRTDASSRLGANNRWGKFWSLSGAWKINSEKFMHNIDFVNDLKLRCSYGTNGNLPSLWTASLALYSFGADYNDGPGIFFTQIANPDLKWEKNNNLNIALEGRIFNRLSFEIEWYNRTTKDLLLSVPISLTTGFRSYYDNIGSITNRGIEVSLKSTNINTKDFLWSTKLNFSHYKSTVNKLVNGDIVSDFPYLLREGESFAAIYMRDWAGVDPKTGKGQWYILSDQKDKHHKDYEKRLRDKNGKYKITQDNSLAKKRIVGDGIPDIIGSLNNTIRYKNFDFSFMFTFKLGGDAYISSHYWIFDDGKSINEAVTKVKLDNYWTKPGQKAKLPKVVYSNPQHTHFNSSRRLVDGTFARLKSVNFGYTYFPKTIINKIRFYASATNLLTLTKINGFDPETTTTGGILANFDFPPMKMINFGVQINF